MDGTLCRLRTSGPRNVLTNMMLVRSTNGRLSAMIMIDPGDERGPNRHWPGRTLAMLQQLAAVQQRIDDGKLPPLADFTAILNPHDSPQQFARTNWCGMVPVLSNSRVSGENRDLMMPDFSFAPFSYLTNVIEANMSAKAVVPRGWPEEREAIYASGRRTPWRQKRRALFWRGGETHEQRRVYSTAITGHTVAWPPEVAADVILCGSHCSLEAGVPPEAWCDSQQLLSLPGHSFAVGFKYTLLCSSLVVRGAYDTGAACKDRSSCSRVYEQFWHAGLRENEHFVTSSTVQDLPSVVSEADRRKDASRIAAHSAAYAYHVLDPDFISEYWHALFSGYAKLFDWRAAERASAADVSARSHRRAPLSAAERTCFGSGADPLFGAAATDFEPLPPLAGMRADCNSTAGMQRLYRRFARVVPLRFTGADKVSDAARTALSNWQSGKPKGAARRRTPSGVTMQTDPS